MDTIQIEKGIPFPTDVRGDIKYPFFSEMGVGNDNANRMKNRLSQATRTYGKKQNPEQHFIVRYRLENEVSGVRVWRKD